MSISFSGSGIERISFAGQEVEEVWFEGVKIWPEGPTSIKDFNPDHLFLYADASKEATAENYRYDYVSKTSNSIFQLIASGSSPVVNYTRETPSALKKGTLLIPTSTSFFNNRMDTSGFTSGTSPYTIAFCFIPPTTLPPSDTFQFFSIGSVDLSGVNYRLRYDTSSDRLMLEYYAGSGASASKTLTLSNISNYWIAGKLNLIMFSKSNNVVFYMINGAYAGANDWTNTAISDNRCNVMAVEDVSSTSESFRMFDLAVWKRKLSLNETMSIYDMYCENYNTTLNVRIPLKILVRNNTGIAITETGSSYFVSGNDIFMPEIYQSIPAGGEGYFYGMVTLNSTFVLWLNLVYESTSNTKAEVRYTINEESEKSLGSTDIGDINISEYLNASFIYKTGGNVFTVTLSNPTT